MLDDRKCGGILCEARWQGAAPAWVVIGLGLNVTNAVPPALAEHGHRAGDDAAGASPPRRWSIPMVEALRRVDAAAGPLDDGERARFARRDWLRGRALAAPVAGTADGLGGGRRAAGARGRTARPTAVRSGTVALAGTSATADLRSCS